MGQNAPNTQYFEYLLYKSYFVRFFFFRLQMKFSAGFDLELVIYFAENGVNATKRDKNQRPK